jgi:serine/threonine protein kinase
MCRKNHSYAADYFAVGVMAYEFMLGKRPYVGKNRKEIRDQILSKQAAVKLE